MGKRILVLCVDRDNDLFTKAKIAGPVIGKEENIKAATKLALADPEEPDANTMFQAVKLAKELERKKYAVLVATLTGSEKLGYAADRELLKQLERVLAEFKANSCIFVSDGAADEQIIPIIQSRIKIDSIHLVVMKQAKELERTYMVLLEKLKEPHYARLVFGIPALIILLFIIGDILGVGWRLGAFIVGAYLLLKGFGVEESVLGYFAGFRLSMEKLSFIFYLGAIPLLIVALAQGYEGYISQSAQENALKTVAYTVEKFLLLFPWAILLVIVGKMLDLVHERRKYELVKYGLYAISVLVLWLIFNMASKWILAEIYFYEFVFTIISAIVVVVLAVKIMDWMKLNIALKMRLENKEVLTELGAYIGRVVGIDGKRGRLIVQTALGQRLEMGLERVVSVEDKVIVRY